MSARTCVITGGSLGIGRAAAMAFAREGANLVLAARGEAALMEAQQCVREEGALCEAVVADVSQVAGARRVIAAACESFGRVDVLVNNAGAAPLAPIEALTDEEFRACVDVNISSVFYMTREVWPLMRTGGGGVIVNISSVASQSPFPGFAVYGACKAWVNLFTQAMNEEGKPFGIRVVAVAPGAVETRMLRERFPDLPAEAVLDPEEVASAIAACARDDLGALAGQTLFVRK